MNTYTKQQNARIPSYSLSYLINGDDSGLCADDKPIIDKWFKSWQDVADRVNGSVVISPTGEREFFTRFPEFGLSCECTECDIVVLTDNKEIEDEQ